MDDRTLLTGNDVARMLRVSRSMAYSLMRRGSLRSVRFGRAVRVQPSDLQEFIAAHCDPEPSRAAGTDSAPSTIHRGC